MKILKDEMESDLMEIAHEEAKSEMKQKRR